jgi:hypothetical protein
LEFKPTDGRLEGRTDSELEVAPAHCAAQLNLVMDVNWVVTDPCDVILAHKFVFAGNATVQDHAKLVAACGVGRC